MMAYMAYKINLPQDVLSSGEFASNSPLKAG
jgi:hypothetical protein